MAEIQKLNPKLWAVYYEADGVKRGKKFASQEACEEFILGLEGEKDNQPHEEAGADSDSED